MKRSAGILLPISSLPSNYGIGTLGIEARKFIDFLVEAKQSYWQILPIGPTSYGDSPYSSFSSFAGNPYFIDFDLLEEEGLLKKEEYQKINWGKNKEDIDYGLLYEKRFMVLHKAVDRLYRTQKKEFLFFCEEEKYWLEDYASYMAIKNSLGGISLENWPKALRKKEKKVLQETKEKLKDEILFFKAIQYLFFKQWQALKAYAKEKGIGIIGDLPIYVARDSADVWANPEVFQLNKDGKPTLVAGVPPDYFSEDGQLWGNPLYDWKAMEKNQYDFWMKRIYQQFRFYDVLRIDHFRGFESYYAIKANAKNAKVGSWKKGPGKTFFTILEKKMKGKEIIAEDLGFLTDKVYALLEDCGYPGMKVLEFAFSPDDQIGRYLPHNYDENCIVYLGTHDNDTVVGWLKTAEKSHTKRAKDYFQLNEKEGYNWGMIRGAYSSVAKLAIIQCQDILGLDNAARINIPSTVGMNWRWRMKKNALKKKDAKRLADLCALYQRGGE
ncbi:MAG: 4-alpha-glucanotransferase [Solobacterium sp.]|nr:4-alpha-glucanotransferase [Solobacterium sp.]